jgi:hypothetical protein
MLQSSTFFVRLDAATQDGTLPSNYTLSMDKDNINLTTETRLTFNVNAVGLYTVNVTSPFGCSRIRTIVTSFRHSTSSKILS